MAISYPINLPTVKAPARLTIRAISVVGVQASPFTQDETVHVWDGDRWEIDVELPPMRGWVNGAAIAEKWVAFLLKLNGREGTFLAGHTGYAGPYGTWAGQSPQVQGANAAGARTLFVKNVTPGRTALEGDWIQLGSGSSSRLHKVVQDATFDTGGTAALEIWPRLRAAYADGNAITLTAPKGRWRLAANAREWSIELAQVYGLRFSAGEARD